MLNVSTSRNLEVARHVWKRGMILDAEYIVLETPGESVPDQLIDYVPLTAAEIQEELSNAAKWAIKNVE
jgi:hypothetical protein